MTTTYPDASPRRRRLLAAAAGAAMLAAALPATAAADPSMSWNMINASSVPLALSSTQPPTLSSGSWDPVSVGQSALNAGTLMPAPPADVIDPDPNAALWAFDSGLFDDTVATGTYELTSLWMDTAVGPFTYGVTFDAEDPRIESDSFACTAMDTAAQQVQVVYTTSAPYTCTVYDAGSPAGGPVVVVDYPNPNAANIADVALVAGPSALRLGGRAAAAPRVARVELRDERHVVHGRTSARLVAGRKVRVRVPMDRALRKRLRAGRPVTTHLRVSLVVAPGQRSQVGRTITVKPR